MDVPVDVERRKAVRRRVLPGVAMLTALVAGATGLTGCTDGNGIGVTGDAKGGGSTATPAQPGKYRSLPEPCKAADGKRLRAMLPAADSLTTEERDRLYAGTADASFDGDRRVGCRWNAQVPEGTLLLSVRFERVVSYDRAAMSDDDKARQVYVSRLTAAHLPFPGPTASPTPSAASTPAAPGTPNPGGSTAPSPGPSAPPAPAGSPATSPSGSATGSPSTSPTSPPELGSRVLEGLGNEAYIEDKLSAAGATAAQARTVRIVFRTSNVLVTVEYSVQPSAPGTVPPSGETQDKTRQLAQALAERFNE
ncbi:DUF3558 domain-containing protein [Streptomyces sp. RerS4]|uniref:DUF3558 domain-containing protein n=1 Tax=Streptomyces sp. RerS4 TaxID=2942449 RepID=UPI00201C39DC|nr:DUF3558 domain-containing protein [Streptomyces sp. RerS4]UQX01624.1 DUF3558 domain-containing protein [Streptomyces sp. RerS4]